MAARREQWRSSMAEGDVGIIGLGAMGGAIARNLVAAGLRVAGYDLIAERRQALTAAGGIARDWLSRSPQPCRSS